MKIVSFLSFTRGVGRSSLAANLAVLLAARGRSVALVDANLLDPSLHLFFGLADDEIEHGLNAFLTGQQPIEEVLHDLTPRRGPGTPGHLYLVPASPEVGEIMRVLKDGYDVDLLNNGLQRLSERFGPDLLLVETHAGLDDQVLNLMAISDAVEIVLHLAMQDYQGTAVMVEVAGRLGVPQVGLLLNEVPEIYDPDAVKKEVENKYNCEVIGMVPYCEQMTMLESGDLFVLQFPDHPVTKLLADIAERLDD